MESIEIKAVNCQRFGVTLGNMVEFPYMNIEDGSRLEGLSFEELQARDLALEEEFNRRKDDLHHTLSNFWEIKGASQRVGKIDDFGTNTREVLEALADFKPASDVEITCSLGLAPVNGYTFELGWQPQAEGDVAGIWFRFPFDSRPDRMLEVGCFNKDPNGVNRKIYSHLSGEFGTHYDPYLRPQEVRNNMETLCKTVANWPRFRKLALLDELAQFLTR